MTAVPSVPPGTGPSQRTFVVGLDGNATGTHTAGPAPTTVHVSALGLTTGATDWLDERYSWDFGDRADERVVTGPVAAHRYASPGNYTVRLTRTAAAGATTAYAATVIVRP